MEPEMKPYTETLRNLEDGTREVIFRNVIDIGRFVDEAGRTIKQVLGTPVDSALRYDITGRLDSHGQLVQFYEVKPSQ